MLTCKTPVTQRNAASLESLRNRFSIVERTYVSQDCPYSKVDVKFRAIGRPERNSEGRVTLVESDDDIIIGLSRLYLAYSVMD